MDWLKLITWASGLTIVPKIILSGVLLGIVAIVLVLVWTPSPPVPPSPAPRTARETAPASAPQETALQSSPQETAVKSILGMCYRRAVFTRMHAQTSRDAMFTSIDECRQTLQKNIPNIRRRDLQGTAEDLLAILDQIGRYRNVTNSDDDINKLKLGAVHNFRVLAAATNESYPLPEPGKLGEALYFTQAEADAALSQDDLTHQMTINPDTGQTIAP